MSGRRTLAIGGVAIVAVALVAYAAFEAGIEHGRTNASATVATANATRAAPSEAASAPAVKAADVDPSTGKRVLYWHDPMVPGPKFDKPGKSPFMDMQLVPVYADHAADEGKVSISPRTEQNLGIRIAEASAGQLEMG